MSIKLDLTKSAKELRLQLDKAGVASDIKAQIIVNMDVSGSFHHEHEEGTTNTLMNRLMPVAMELDPDRSIDLVTFSDGPSNVQYVGTVTEKNAKNFILDNVVDRVRGWNGGTTYSHALTEALERFGWLECDNDHGTPASRFLGNLFGATPEKHSHEKQRSIVIHVTDGENDPGNNWGDKAATRKLLRDSQKRGDNVYFLFIGACEHQDFEFVRDIAAEFKNTGIVMATDPEEFVELSDRDLMQKLLVPELIEWLKK